MSGPRSARQPIETQVGTFEPTMAASRQVRELVVELLHQWGLDHLVDDVSLCAAELASNAVLHTRTSFTLTVRPAGTGVRIDILDSFPAQLPVVIPTAGSAVDLTSSGTTGRGLQIVAALAGRWGVSTTDDAKTVWAELPRDDGTAAAGPVLALGHRPEPADGPALHFLALPVRAAVASGIQVDELIREIQLNQRRAHPLAVADHDRLFELIDRSAPARLTGRHAALRAAGTGASRFDLDLRVTADSLAAASALGRLLARLTEGSSLSVPVVGDDVVAFRTWIDDEAISQRAGHLPRVCPLDD